MGQTGFHCTPATYFDDMKYLRCCDRIDVFLRYGNNRLCQTHLYKKKATKVTNNICDIAINQATQKRKHTCSRWHSVWDMVTFVLTTAIFKNDGNKFRRSQEIVYLKLGFLKTKHSDSQHNYCSAWCIYWDKGILNLAAIKKNCRRHIMPSFGKFHLVEFKSHMFVLFKSTVKFS